MSAVTVLLVILALIFDLGDGGRGGVWFVSPPAKGQTVTNSAKDTCTGKTAPHQFLPAAVLLWLSLPINNFPPIPPFDLILKIIHASLFGSSGGPPC